MDARVRNFNKSCIFLIFIHAIRSSAAIIVSHTKQSMEIYRQHYRKYNHLYVQLIHFLAGTSCDGLSNIQNAVAEATAMHAVHTYGSTVTYHCRPGFDAGRGVDTIDVTCDIVGQWTPKPGDQQCSRRNFSLALGVVWFLSYYINILFCMDN